MVFLVKNESKIGTFYLSGKMGSACIAAKNRQGAFWTAEKQAGHCTLLKMPRGNTITPLEKWAINPLIWSWVWIYWRRYDNPSPSASFWLIGY